MEGLEISEVRFSESRTATRCDAEYFRPSFIALQNRVEGSAHTTLGAKSIFVAGPFGSEFHVENYDEKSRFRYIRGKDVKSFFVEDGDSVHLPEADFWRLVQHSVKEKDVLVSVVGTLGNACIAMSEDIPAVFSCKNTIIRDSDVNPFFLVAFLNSTPGRSLLLRNARGTVQLGLNIPDLRQIPVPKFSSVFQDTMENVINKSRSSLSTSKVRSAKTVRVLMRALGLENWQPPEPLTYTRQASEIFATGRFDAEIFQPRYDALRAVLKNKAKLHRLDSFGEIVAADFAPIPNQQYCYTEISDVNVSNGAVGWNFVRGAELPANAKIRLNGGELLVSKVRPTRGAVGINDESTSSDHVCSGAFLVIRAASPCREFLQVFLRSFAGKLLLEERCKGSSYPTLDDDDIRAVLVPEVGDELMVGIRNNVVAAHAARRRAHILLERAKRAVEIAIEETETAALRFLAKPEETCITPNIGQPPSVIVH